LTTTLKTARYMLYEYFWPIFSFSSPSLNIYNVDVLLGAPLYFYSIDWFGFISCE
jgi:hypothetical protein